MQSVKLLMNRLRGVRHLEWILLALCLAAGILLLGRAGWVEPDAGAHATPLEQRLERVLSSVSGAGRVRVLVKESEAAVAAFGQSPSTAQAQVEGVLVVAEGAGDLRVSLELNRAVQALLGVDASAIEVLKMEKEE